MSINRYQVLVQVLKFKLSLNEKESFTGPMRKFHSYYLVISFRSSIITEVEISSVLGQKMMRQNINNLQAEMNLSNLPNGIYFVKVKSDGASKTIKIIKK